MGNLDYTMILDGQELTYKTKFVDWDETNKAPIVERKDNYIFNLKFFVGTDSSGQTITAFTYANVRLHFRRYDAEGLQGPSVSNENISGKIKWSKSGWETQGFSNFNFYNGDVWQQCLKDPSLQDYIQEIEIRQTKIPLKDSYGRGDSFEYIGSSIQMDNTANPRPGWGYYPEEDYYVRAGILPQITTRPKVTILSRHEDCSFKWTEPTMVNGQGAVIRYRCAVSNNLNMTNSQFFDVNELFTTILEYKLAQWFGKGFGNDGKPFYFEVLPYWYFSENGQRGGQLSLLPEEAVEVQYVPTQWPPTSLAISSAKGSDTTQTWQNVIMGNKSQSNVKLYIDKIMRSWGIQSYNEGFYMSSEFWETIGEGTHYIQLSNSFDVGNESYEKFSNALVFVYEPAYKTIKWFNGYEWEQCRLYCYDGSQWIPCNPYVYDGSVWKPCNSK